MLARQERYLFTKRREKEEREEERKVRGERGGKKGRPLHTPKKTEREKRDDN